MRNPYARVVSAYLDKVKKPGSWRRRCHKFGFQTELQPTLLEFLPALKSRDPYRVDHHFRWQHVNLLHGFSPLDFLGYLENMEPVNQFLLALGFCMTTSSRHATNAASRVGELLGAKEADAIRRQSRAPLAGVQRSGQAHCSGLEVVSDGNWNINSQRDTNAGSNRLSIIQ